MSAFGDRLAEHWANNKKRKEIEIEEWSLDGEPFKAFFYPITGAEVAQAKADGRQGIDENIELIINKLEDEDGKKIFDIRDRGVLKSQPADTIGFISQQMTLYMHGDALKN